MARKMSWKWLLIPVLGFALLAGGVVVQVQAGKPGGGGGGTTDPPPVRYNIVWLDKLGYPSSTAEDVNEYGDVVGSLDVISGGTSSHAFLSTGGVLSDINVLAAGAIPTGWTACQACSINNQGQIVGKAAHSDGHTCGFLYDPTATPPFVLLYEMDSARLINNNADIVGYVAADDAVVLDTWNADSSTYETTRWPGIGVPDGLNDSGMIVATAVPVGTGVKRYDPDFKRWDDFSGYPFSMTWGGGINNNGTFVGRRKVDSARGKSVDAAFRCTASGTINNILIQNLALGYDVNLQNDVVLWDGRRSQLHTENDGLWPLDKLVVGDTAEWVNAVRIDAWAMTDRDGATGFPLICGRVVGPYDKVTGNTVSAFLLTPVP